VRVALKAQVDLSAFDALLPTVVNDDPLAAIHERDFVARLLMLVQRVV